MVRNNYEDTIFVITNKLNNKLDVFYLAPTITIIWILINQLLNLQKSLVTLMTYSSKS